MVKSVKKMVKPMKAKRPVGVTIVAVLYFLVAILTAVIGVFMIINSSLIAPFMEVYTPALAGNVASMFVTGGIFAIAGAVVALLVGLGLWRLRNWARIVVLVFAVLGAVSSFMKLPLGLTWLVVHGLIIWYLGFNKNAIAHFR